MPHFTWEVNLGNVLIIVTILGTFLKMYGKFTLMSSRVDEMWEWFIDRSRDDRRRGDDRYSS